MVKNGFVAEVILELYIFLFKKKHGLFDFKTS